MITFSSTNILFIEKMVIDLSIGAFDCEFNQRQKCEVSLAIEVENLNKIEQDNLDATYNYGQVIPLIRELSTHHYQLVETLAQVIATEILLDKKVISVEVIVAKPGAFVDVTSCGCKIKYYRQAV